MSRRNRLERKFLKILEIEGRLYSKYSDFMNIFYQSISETLGTKLFKLKKCTISHGPVTKILIKIVNTTSIFISSPVI